MRFNNRIFVCFVLVMLYACKTTVVNSPESFKGKEIFIGSGGGVTGMTTTWYILDNGQIFCQKSRQGEMKEIKRLSKSKTAQLFDQIQLLKLTEDDFLHPGDITWFIGLKQPGMNKLTVKWGDSRFPVPEKYTIFYNQTLSVIQP